MVHFHAFQETIDQMEISAQCHTFELLSHHHLNIIGECLFGYKSENHFDHLFISRPFAEVFCFGSFSIQFQSSSFLDYQLGLKQAIIMFNVKGKMSRKELVCSLIQFLMKGISLCIMDRAEDLYIFVILRVPTVHRMKCDTASILKKLRREKRKWRTRLITVAVDEEDEEKGGGRFHFGSWGF